MGGGAIQYNYGQTVPAYERVTSIPSWLPSQGANERELMDQYRGTNAAFDTGAYDQASEAQQSRLLTSALNSGNNAATEYANRARQQGGSALGAGLVKAQAQTSARTAAGGMEMERQKFDASQRAAAATHASQIATTLGTLRDSYLKSLVNYATSEDATMAQYTAKMRELDASRRDRQPRLPFSVGTGLGRDSSDFTFGSEDAMRQYSDAHPEGSPYIALGGYGGGVYNTAGG